MKGKERWVKIPYELIIIGAGLAGLECGRYLKENNFDNFVILEKNSNIIKDNSWKTFKRTVDKFNLKESIYNKINKITLRTIDLSQKYVISQEETNIECYILNSKKIYEDYFEILKKNLILNDEVIDIKKDGEIYHVYTSLKEYQTQRIVDASGVSNIVDNVYNIKNFEYQKDSKDFFNQTAYYTCYAKRYKNCKGELIKNRAFFDFDEPFKLCGTWCYPINDDIVEIGVARFSNTFEMDVTEKLEEIDKLHDDYLRMEPFDKVFENAEEIMKISGYCCLLPRNNIVSDNIYYVGDTKGAVTYSGYGVENALESGRNAAISILENSIYNYYVNPPSKGLAILTLLWNSNIEELRKVSKAVSEMSDERLYQFYTGSIDLGFFVDATKVCLNQKINSLAKIKNFPLVLKALFNIKPNAKDKEVFLKYI